MEIEVQKFVSSKEIGRERREVQEARERVLRDAESKAVARQARQEEATARGDHKWMLPNLEEQLGKKKKKKKEKKKKKDKGSDSDDWEESSNNVCEPAPKVAKVEAVVAKEDAKEEAAGPQRDEFMELGF